MFDSLRITPLRLLRSRLLRPFAGRLLDRRLWRPAPHTIGLGIALGLFFGIVSPVAQIFLAALAATVLRANLMAAAVATLVTNPLTAPPIYLAAYRLGAELLPWLVPTLDAALIPQLEAFSFDALQAMWQGMSLGWAGLSFAIGLVLIACASAIVGYLVAWLVMRGVASRQLAAAARPG
ncbi:DUF2062 domain-containing protein [Niveibacterium umoris]|uniref:DUF2062 domain-containing protein n=1 Tax=Niveibacterium umoris TaxID=1193620 RepID=A0A840BKS0_9RHOO|nr:hypothetical protein [Niveibacterium umoris]